MSTSKKPTHKLTIELTDAQMSDLSMIACIIGTDPATLATTYAMQRAYGFLDGASDIDTEIAVTQDEVDTFTSDRESPSERLESQGEVWECSQHRLRLTRRFWRFATRQKVA